MTFNLRLSRARTVVVAMRQDSSYYNNWTPPNWREKVKKIRKKILVSVYYVQQLTFSDIIFTNTLWCLQFILYCQIFGGHCHL